MTPEDRQLLQDLARDVADIKQVLGSRPGGKALDDLGKIRRTLRHYMRQQRLPEEHIEV